MVMFDLSKESVMAHERTMLARDILLKLIEGSSAIEAASVRGGAEVGGGPDPATISCVAVEMADALLAELAKPKEGA